MTQKTEDLAERALALRKRRDQALVLPLIGLFLLVSPIIGLFANAGRLWGVPVILMYLLLVWVGLIFAAWRLSSRLRGDGGAD